MNSIRQVYPRKTKTYPKKVERKIKKIPKTPTPVMIIVHRKIQIQNSQPAPCLSDTLTHESASKLD